MEQREGNGTKLQPEGTFIRNVGEQADHSVTFSCYAEHIQTIARTPQLKKENAGKSIKNGGDLELLEHVHSVMK